MDSKIYNHIIAEDVNTVYEVVIKRDVNGAFVISYLYVINSILDTMSGRVTRGKLNRINKSLQVISTKNVCFTKGREIYKGRIKTNGKGF
ncbi:hypothetical protein LP032_082 [Listeria phage LP-032]|uniref:Uncharacterized protein n=5 Tax=Homburgvirus TaxID=1921125 RepID=A0A059TAL3_9CAUD|nr:hypothetical protein LP026_079 [Listeria phage LP-026]AHL18931.1 hypothetical protein LP032_082 [Listeria phage LP-032]QDK04603.1 hypothetical protein FK481_0089 [Listeria phage LP-010]QDK04714.1 hypothetical protein FK482_0092 [Listeria phage LP-013]QDK04827.1 hypothetical protein FK484_0094 [Listeria phage LP-031]AHN84773.1 hypothetical protein LP026_079 [Listeria phage LP-026]